MSHCKLVLLANGSAELLSPYGRQLWSSDADDDFKEEVSAEFLNEDDVDDILDYLIDEKHVLTDAEYDSIEVEAEDYVGEPPGDEDEDEEELEDEDQVGESD